MRSAIPAPESFIQAGSSPVSEIELLSDAGGETNRIPGIRTSPFIGLTVAISSPDSTVARRILVPTGTSRLSVRIGMSGTLA